MTNMKQIDPAALAGITTGILMTDFSALHEAAEHVMGCPIWTHQFPLMWPKISEAVRAQFPDMPADLGDRPWEAVRDDVRARYGETVEVRRGAEAGVHPMDPAGWPELLRGRINA